MPGIYIEGLPGGSRPIQAVSTSTAGFVGVAPNALHVNEAVLVTRWAEFERHFASSEAADQKFAPTHLSQAVYGFFLNGGSRCYVVNLGPGGKEITGRFSGGSPLGLDVLEHIDEVAILAAPGFTDPAAYAAMRDTCDRLGDRVGILDGPGELDDAALSQILGVPPVKKSKAGKWTPPEPSAGGLLTLYLPWIEISDPASSRTMLVPPSGHIAGVWARNDAARGVHKAPVNEIVRGAVGLARQITHEEQGKLNEKGVNVIGFFRNEGILVWGADTLTRDPTFRYLNVRRLFNMITQSIAKGTRWSVFEPNDRPLWQSIRRDVTAFLMGFWREGALLGSTPEESFYVKCDQETNPVESVRAGDVIIEVGLALVYPADFIIFSIRQSEVISEVQVHS
jgi:hypothetical protein